jgi:hypothetical protein
MGLEGTVNEVLPSNIPLLGPNMCKLLKQAFDEPLDCVRDKTMFISTFEATVSRTTVVLRTRLVVMIAEKVCGGLRNAGRAQNINLKQTGGSSVPVAKWMDASDI